MRIKNILLRTTVICVMFASLAVAQDFQRNYNLSAGGYISIRNISGNIRVIGYDGENVVVTAYKEGRDRDRVEIVDASGENYLNIYVNYPRYGNTDASVYFDIQVPRNMQYNYEDLSSVSGDISISMIAGQIQAESVSGKIEVLDVLGAVKASSVSGDVYVQITEPEAKRYMRFSSVSGDVVVHAPADLDTYVDLSTISGSLWTDFPIRIIGRWGSLGRTARGRLGNGTGSLKISSISGRVCLLKIRS